MRFIGVILAVLYLAGCSDTAKEVSKNTQSPAAPGELKATGSGNTVELQWSASIFAEGYTVYWSFDKTAALADWQSTKGIKTPSFTFTLTEQHAVVYVRVSASNRYGESSPGPVLTRVLPPILSATEGNTKVGLRWPRAAGVSYTIYWSNLSGINKSNAAVIPDVQSEPFLHDNLTNNQIYYYFVTARVGTDESDPSNIVSATPNTSVNDAPVLSTPAALTVDENKTAVVKLQATDADGNEISYTIAAGLDNDLFDLDRITGNLAFKAAWTPDYEWPQDTNGDNLYQITVRAGDGIGYAESILQITVRDVLDDRGTAPQVNAAGIKRLRFSWTPLRSATHYKIYQNPDGTSVYTQIGGDFTNAEYTMDVAVHRLDWVNARFYVEACNSSSFCFTTAPVGALNAMIDTIGYIKATNTSYSAVFGESVTLSADGNTLAVGAPGEGSAARGIGGEMVHYCSGQLPVNCEWMSGAVYVYSRVYKPDSTNSWTGPIYFKASNTGAYNFFGDSVALSADGNTLAVGAPGESGGARGVVGNMTIKCSANCESGSGAVYVYNRVYKFDGTYSWTGPVYIKASNTRAFSSFGQSVALSADGNTLAVGAFEEDSAGIGVNGIDLCLPTCAVDSGAVYVYSRFYNPDGTNYWTGPVYIKAPNTGSRDFFGRSVTLSANGNTLAVGADGESSAADGVAGNMANDCLTATPVNCAIASGAVYVYNRSSSTNSWIEPVVYIKAPNTSAGGGGNFGHSVTISADGNTLAVGAYGDDSAARGVGGNMVHNCMATPPENCAEESGAVYVYSRGSGANPWTEPVVYIKASNTSAVALARDTFGQAVTLSADGNTLAVGAYGEDSAARGVGGNMVHNCMATPPENCAEDSGAVYVYSRGSGANPWTEPVVYTKPSNAGIRDHFGWSVALSADGSTLAAGASWENSAAVGVGGGNTADQTDRCSEKPPVNCMPESGAVYLY